MSLYVDDMKLYIQNSKVSTQKLLDLIKRIQQSAGYKINIQKSVAFLYTNNEITERECREKKKTFKKITLGNKTKK